MRVAVCCPGPSLPQTWKDGDAYDVVYAVNRALLVVRADWLSAGDICLFQTLLGGARPLVGTFTMVPTREMIKADKTWGRIDTWEESRGFIEHRAVRPINWSVQAALVHAADSGATSIDLYGADCTARHDCTGYEGENRNPERWAREEADLAATFGYLSGRGVCVSRIRLH